jgi:hypothetical protein
VGGHGLGLGRAAAAALVEAAMLVEAAGLVEAAMLVKAATLVETARIDTQRVGTPVESFARPAARLPRVGSRGQA